jgi:hypothetical protein
MSNMQDPSTSRYGNLLKRYLKAASDAGLQVSKQGEGWQIKTLSGALHFCASGSEFVSYMKGYLGE